LATGYWPLATTAADELVERRHAGRDPEPAVVVASGQYPVANGERVAFRGEFARKRRQQMRAVLPGAIVHDRAVTVHFEYAHCTACRRQLREVLPDEV
jgi:hypothetical protein